MCGKAKILYALLGYAILSMVKVTMDIGRGLIYYDDVM